MADSPLRQGGWPTRSIFFWQLTPPHDTTPVLQRWVTVLLFPGGRPFRFSKGRGFEVLCFLWPTISSANVAEFSGRRDRTASLLAAQVLRLQCLESQEGVEKLHYMHMNPLKRKLVSHPKDWPWSTFAFCAKPGSGLIRVGPVR